MKPFAGFSVLILVAQALACDPFLEFASTKTISRLKPVPRNPAGAPGFRDRRDCYSFHRSSSRLFFPDDVICDSFRNRIHSGYRRRRRFRPHFHRRPDAVEPAQSASLAPAAGRGRARSRADAAGRAAGAARGHRRTDARSRRAVRRPSRFSRSRRRRPLFASRSVSASDCARRARTFSRASGPRSPAAPRSTIYMKASRKR